MWRENESKMSIGASIGGIPGSDTNWRSRDGDLPLTTGESGVVPF